MVEKSVANSNEKSRLFVILTLIVLLIGVIIAIPIVYSVNRNSGLIVNAILTNVTIENGTNECTPSYIEALAYYNQTEPFPFKPFNYLYRPSVILKEIDIIFGFRHDNRSWSLDKLSMIDTTTGEDRILDGDFESNYLTKNYKRCVLSNTRSSGGDIIFDNPYSGDFYYNDQTNNGMAYLTQSIGIVGGRYYNITFYLENRGYPNNTFLLLIGYNKKK